MRHIGDVDHEAELRTLWYDAERRANEANAELDLLRGVVRTVVEDCCHQGAVDEVRCLHYADVTHDQYGAVIRALGGAA